MAMNGGESFKSEAEKSLPLLWSVVQDCHARDEHNVLATEKAMASLVRIARAGVGYDTLADFLSSFLKLPPMTNDETECIYVYAFFAKLLQQEPAPSAEISASLRAWMRVGRASGRMDGKTKEIWDAVLSKGGFEGEEVLAGREKA